MRSKARLGRLLGATLRSSVFRRPMQRFFLRHAPMTFYHGLWPDGSARLGVFGGRSLEGFRDDMRLMARHFRFAPMSEILARNTSGEAPAEPLMAICFDDGHDMIRTGALEIFAEFGISATVFVITSVIGNPRLMWMHRLFAVAHLRGVEALAQSYNGIVEKRRCGPPIRALTDLPYAARSWPMVYKDEIAGEIFAEADMPPEPELLEEWQPYMSWADLRAWVASGHDVGLHTATHPFCSQLTAADMQAEFVGPATLLRHELAPAYPQAAGVRPLPFAYPFGDRLADPALERVVHGRAGLSCMLGVEGLSRLGTPPWRLERVEGEAGLDLRLFGRPVMRAITRRQTADA